MSKYVKVMFDTTSGAKNDLVYKIDEVNVSNDWDPTAKNGKDFGGFNYTSEEYVLRWLHRGDTIYDVIVPKDAENIQLESATPIYRTNKIIVSNPRKVDDDLALHYYEISKIPEKAYYKALGVVSIMNYKKTAYRIIKDRVNSSNIDEVLEEWNNFISHDNKNDRKNVNELVSDVEELLNEIKSDLLISRFIDKEPYIKEITNDRVINITGESGSGKSYFSNKYINDDNYIVIDTDIVFSDRISDNKESVELRNIFKDKPKDYLMTCFDEFYIKALDYFKSTNKTIVIDSAQYRNINDCSRIKGKMIIMRTSIETCYERVTNRWKLQNKDYTEEEYQQYSNKKIGMFNWYKGLNTFIKCIDELN